MYSVTCTVAMVMGTIFYSPHKLGADLISESQCHFETNSPYSGS